MIPRSQLGQIRFAAGFKSIEKASKALNCSRIHLAEIERGAGTPSDELLQKMSAIYEVPAQRLLEFMLEDQKDYHRRAMKRLA